MSPTAAEASDLHGSHRPAVLDRAWALSDALAQTWAWARAPLDEAEAVARELVELAERRDLPYAALRMLTQIALGEEARAAVVDRWLEQDPEVVGVLARVRQIGRDLDGMSARARTASRRAVELALEAPRVAKQAAAAVFALGPTAARDEILRGLERLPARLKCEADHVRAEAALAGARAETARRRIVEGLRARARAGGLQRTDRLAAVR